MTENQILLILLALMGIVLVAAQSHRRKMARLRREKIAEQVQRIEAANKPGYRLPDSGMETLIKDGVVTYRRRRARARQKTKEVKKRR